MANTLTNDDDFKRELIANMPLWIRQWFNYLRIPMEEFDGWSWNEGQPVAGLYYTRRHPDGIEPGHFDIEQEFTPWWHNPKRWDK
jgi:hypothetical protein